MTSPEYSDKKIEYIMNQKILGKTNEEIAESYNKRFGEDKTPNAIRKIFNKYKSAYELPEFDTNPEKIKKQKKKEVLNQFKDMVKENQYVPSKREVLEAGISESTIKTHFGSYEELEKEARDKHAGVFKSIIDENSFTDELYKEQVALVKKHKRVVVVTAVNGCDVHEAGLKSIESYCKRNNAALLVLPCSDPASNLYRKYNWNLDPRLPKDQVVFKNLKLNESIFLAGIKRSAKQIKPLQGLSRIAQSEGSFISASPKQDLEIVGSGPDDNSRIAMMTSGAITVPNYNTESYMSESSAFIANHDHVLGGIIVELVDKKKFHFRQFQIEPATGKFRDLNKEYTPDGSVKKIRADIVRFGDYHVDELDPRSDQMGKEVCEVLKPRFLLVEDAFNGNSVSHWDRGNPIKQAEKHDEGMLSLPDEGNRYAEALQKLLKYPVGMVVNIYGNHEDFLVRYLSDITAPYLREPQNTKLAVRLLNAILQDGTMPHEFMVRKVFGIDDKRLKFLKLDEHFAPNGIENGAHGHIGLNGHYNPTMDSIQKAYGACNVGHNHTPGIRNKVFRVGTFSILRPGFVKGPSTWMHTLLIEHENGSRQLINLVKDKWFLDDGILD